MGAPQAEEAKEANEPTASQEPEEKAGLGLIGRVGFTRMIGFIRFM